MAVAQIGRCWQAHVIFDLAHYGSRLESGAAAREQSRLESNVGRIHRRFFLD
jgi:hypothetical protein